MVVEKGKVSVVMPVYNDEKTLLKCLNSIKSQQEDYFELIIVDNNSTDGTKKILETFIEKNPKTKYFLEKKKGRGSARNRGIREVKGSIIVMTDADCTVPKDWIKNITKPIIKENETVVMGFQKDGIKNYWTTQGQRLDEVFIKSKGKKYITHLDTKNFAIKSDVMKNFLFNPNLTTSEDLDLYFRLSTNYKVRFLRNVKVTHYHHLTFVELINVFFERGFNTIKVIKLHKKNKQIAEEIKRNNVYNNLSIFKMFYLLLVRLFISPAELSYILVTGVSWQIGALFGRFSKIQ